MPRRKNENNLNPEEFLEGNEEPRDGDGDAIVEIFRGVKARQDDDSISESNGLANLPSTLVAQNQDDQWEPLWDDIRNTAVFPPLRIPCSAGSLASMYRLSATSCTTRVACGCRAA